MRTSGERKPAASRRAGVSVVGVLGGAAVLGLAGGALLARRGATPEEALETADRLVDQAMPSTAMGQTIDITLPDPISLRGIPPYPGADPRRISGSNPHATGLSAISWFSTQDSVDKVLSFYDEVYTRANLLHVSYRYNERRGYVSWFERHVGADGGSSLTDGLLHMVSASNEGSQTMVFISATEPYKLLEAVSPLPSGVKLPEGAGRPQVMHLGEMGEDRFTVYASYQRARDEVAQDLEALLKEGGWSVDERTVSPEGTVSLVARSGDRMQTASIEGTISSAQVLLSVEPQRRGVSP